jgi:hypothetical protein
MNSLRAYRKSSDLPLQRRLKGSLGNLLMAVDRKLSHEVKAAPFRHPWSTTGRLIRNGHLQNAVASGDHALICRFLVDFWSSPASADFYTNLSHRYETLFLKHHQAIVGETVKTCDKAAGGFRQLIELGAGDGKVLEHFSRHLPILSEVHGIDINADQVSTNRQVYADQPKLQFHHADIRKWIPEHVSSGAVVIVNGGVLEYLTRPELLAMFKHLADQSAPCVVAITESIATDHDLENESETYPYGLELSLSHNYLAILRECGFTIEFTHDRLTSADEFGVSERWLQVVAVYEAKLP